MQPRNNNLLLAITLLNLPDEILKLLHRLPIDILHIPKRKHQIIEEIVEGGLALFALAGDHRQDLLVVLVEVQVGDATRETVEEVVVGHFRQVVLDRDYLCVVLVVVGVLDLLEGRRLAQLDLALPAALYDDLGRGGF
jgi:hypothetical protein